VEIIEQGDIEVAVCCKEIIFDICLTCTHLKEDSIRDVWKYVKDKVLLEQLAEKKENTPRLSLVKQDN